jgi:protein TonB
MVFTPPAVPQSQIRPPPESRPIVVSPPGLRHSQSLASAAQEPATALSWLLALSLACLTTGLIGLATPTRTPVGLLTQAAAPAEGEPSESALLEMSAPLSEPATAESATPPTLEIALPEPSTLPDISPPTIDLPQPIASLTPNDVFEVPAAAPIESLLKPETPRRDEPAAPTTPRSNPSTASSTRPSSATNASATPGAGGSGGTGTSSRGSSKGYFPAPPYPAAARSRGMQGTVYLSITFGSDGRVTTTSVSRSSGYSDLDSAASSWVRRNWRAAPGQTGTFRQPVQFRLR